MKNCTRNRFQRNQFLKWRALWQPLLKRAKPMQQMIHCWRESKCNKVLKRKTKIQHSSSSSPLLSIVPSSFRAASEARRKLFSSGESWKISFEEEDEQTAPGSISFIEFHSKNFFSLGTWYEKTTTASSKIIVVVSIVRCQCFYCEIIFSF